MLTTPVAYEDVKGDEDHHYVTLFDDHPVGERCDGGFSFDSVDEDREGRDAIGRNPLLLQNSNQSHL